MLNPIIPPPSGSKTSWTSSLGWGNTEGMSSKLPGLHWEYEGTEGNKYTSKPIYLLSYLITYGFPGASQGQSLWDTKCHNWLTICQQDSFSFSSSTFIVLAYPIQQSLKSLTCWHFASVIVITHGNESATDLSFFSHSILIKVMITQTIFLAIRCLSYEYFKGNYFFYRATSLLLFTWKFM